MVELEGIIYWYRLAQLDNLFAGPLHEVFSPFEFTWVTMTMLEMIQAALGGHKFTRVIGMKFIVEFLSLYTQKHGH